MRKLLKTLNTFETPIFFVFVSFLFLHLSFSSFFLVLHFTYILLFPMIVSVIILFLIIKLNINSFIIILLLELVSDLFSLLITFSFYYIKSLFLKLGKFFIINLPAYSLHLLISALFFISSLFSGVLFFLFPTCFFSSTGNFHSFSPFLFFKYRFVLLSP